MSGQEPETLLMRMTIPREARKNGSAALTAQVDRYHGVPALRGELLEAPLGEVHPRRHDENVEPVRFSNFFD
jgi:hypothetical protein